MSNGTGGSLLASPLATVRQNPENVIYDAFGRVIPPKNDPAWQPPKDPLDVKNPRVQANVINREIPIVVVQTGWSIQQVRNALEALVIGLFDFPAQLVDSIIGDSRVQSAMASRIGGLMGRPLKFTLPPKYKDDDRAKECLDVWQRHWPTMASEPILSDMQLWATNLGFWVGQELWDTTGEYWLPYLQPWHPRYTYYHWIFRRYIAITLDGQVPIFPGDGHWVIHAPYGLYRGWMRGAVRAISPWWLARNYALRDWARYSERHGMPVGKAITPFGADPAAINKFRADLSQLGQESMLQLPQSGDEQIGKYDLEWLETTDQAWDGFQGLITQCNAEITLAILGQNLTSEVKEGSFAAARIHADVRQAILEADARALSQTIYTQIARPFAAINFGDADLAPITEWDVSPYEDNQVATQCLVSFASAISSLRAAGHKINDVVALARQFGLFLKVGDIEEVDPIQVQTKKTGTEEKEDA